MFESADWVRLAIGLGFLGVAWVASMVSVKFYWVRYWGKPVTKTQAVSFLVFAGVMMLGFPLGAVALLAVLIYFWRHVRRWEAAGKSEGAKERFPDY